MATHVQMENGWYDQLKPDINQLVVKVTRAIRQDAQAICPVDTGDLKASLEQGETNPEYAVGRIGSHLPYCAAVELGFHGLEFVRAHMRNGRPVRAHIRQGNSPEQPFLRPAMYRTRDLSSL